MQTSRECFVVVLALCTTLLLAVGCGGKQQPALDQPVSSALDTSTAVAAGRIHGIKIGDSLERCLAVLGEPEKQGGGGQAGLLVYEYPAKGLRVEFTPTDRVVSSIALVLAPDEALPELRSFVPQDVAVEINDWAPFKAEVVDRWIGYSLPAFKAWILSSPDERRRHAVILTSRKDVTPPAGSAITPPVEPLIMVVEDQADVDAPDPVSFREILRGNSADWEQGQVSGPALWSAPDGLHMAYWGGRSSCNIGFARSSDGVTWLRDRDSPLPLPAGVTMALNPLIIPGTGQLFADAHGNGGSLGTYAWQLRSNGTWSSRGVVSRLGVGAPWQIAPQCVVRVGDRWFLFYYSGNHPESKGHCIILRCESIDGTTWTNHVVVLKPSPSGFDAGQVTCPSVHYEASTGTWTMWYMANSRISGSESNLGRAVSRDGLRFTDRELFLRPASLDPSFTMFGSGMQMNVPGGSYLYLGVTDASRNFRIIRLEVEAPHKARAIG